MGRRLGALVRQFRQAAHLTQRQLAELAGLSLGALRDLEQGRIGAPRPETIRRVAEVLRLPADQADQLAQAAGPRAGLVPADDRWLAVLGPLAVRIDGVALTLRSHRRRLLLGRLALTPEQPVSLGELTELVWDGQTPDNGDELVRVSLARLRRRLPAGMLAVDRGGYRLAVRDDQLDLAVFRSLVDDARRLRQQREPELASRRFEAAVALWRGEPVADLDRLAAHPVVAGLRAQWRSVAVEAAAALIGAGRPAAALPLVRRVLADDPLHEAAHVQLMAALAGTGEQEAALAAFRELRDRLADQLGVDPSPELLDAFHRIQERDGSAGPGSVPDPAVWVQPAVGSPVNVHRLLPPVSADFTGRTAQLEELHQRWAADPQHSGVMILTVVGMGGAGKTSLAVHFAHQLRTAGHYPDGEWYVDLRGHATEPPADPGMVLASFLHLLGVGGSQVPADPAEAAALFRDRLAGHRMLLLLDNAASAEQVQPLLPAGGSLVLVTSRRALALDGAHLLPLAGFAAGEAEQLLARVAGADRVASEPAAATRIAELCGRLPLAVSLAARQLRADPARRLADLAHAAVEHRLDVLAAGTGWLATALDLSYRVLTPPEQRMFRLLGLHPGEEFSQYAAAALAGLDPAGAAAHQDRLVDEHLVMVAPGDRYRLHDLLRAQAERRTHADEPPPERRAALTRLLDYYLHTAARASDALSAPLRLKVELTGTAPDHGPALPDPAAAQSWLEAEHATLLAAATLAAGSGWLVHAWQLVHEMRAHLYGRGRPQDWAALQELGLRAAQAAGDRYGEVMIRADFGVALVAGNPRLAQEHLYRALELAPGVDLDPTLRVNIMIALGEACRRLGRYAEALRLLEQAVDLGRAQGDTSWEATALGIVGRIERLLGRPTATLAHYRRALAGSRQAGNTHNEVIALVNLAYEYMQLGRYQEALASMAEFDQLVTARGPYRLRAITALGRGRIYRELGQPDVALRHLREAQERMQREAVNIEAQWETLVLLGGVHLDLGEPDRAHDLLRRALALAIDTAGRYEEARSHAALAELYHRTGQPDQATEHEREAKAIYAELGVPPPRPAATARAGPKPAGPSAHSPMP